MDPIKVEFNINFYRESSCFYEKKKQRKKNCVFALQSIFIYLFFSFFVHLFLYCLVPFGFFALWRTSLTKKDIER